LAADKYGRRQTLLWSIGLQGVCTIWFSYATGWSVFHAALSRLVGGMLNGSVPIAKTYVSEITDASNQGKVRVTRSHAVGLGRHAVGTASAYF
jgi:MFS family permease